MTEEEWRLTQNPGYEVSSLGRVRSLDRTIIMGNGRTRRVKGKLLKPGTTAGGHQLVVIGRELGSRFIHRLVLEAFVGLRPVGMVCCHNNGDPADNRIENLRWDTYSSNSRDAVEHGSCWMSNRTHCPRGHPYSGDNLRVRRRKDGRVNRLCRECGRFRGRINAANSRARKKATQSMDNGD